MAAGRTLLRRTRLLLTILTAYCCPSPLYFASTTVLKLPSPSRPKMSKSVTLIRSLQTQATTVHDHANERDDSDNWQHTVLKKLTTTSTAAATS